MKVTDFQKNIFTLLSGNGLAMLIPLMVAPIVSRLYNPTHFGEFAIIASLTALLAIVVCMRYEQALVLPAKDEDAHAIVSISLSITKRVTLGLALLTVICFFGLRSQYPQFVQYLWVLPFFAPVIGIYTLGYNWLNRIKEYKRQATAKVSQMAAITLTTLILGYFEWGTWGLILANLMGFVVGALIFLPAIRPMLMKARVDKEVQNRFIDFPRMNMPNAFIESLNQQFIFNAFLARFFGVPILGQFAFAHRYVRAPLKLMNAAISHVFYKEAVDLRAAGQSFRKLADKTMLTVFLIAFPFCALLFFYGEPLFAWVFGENWARAGAFAQILSPLLLLNFVIGGIMQTPNVCGRQKAYFKINVTAQIMGLMAILVAHSFDASAETAVWAYVLVTSFFELVKIFWFRKLSLEKSFPEQP